MTTRASIPMNAGFAEEAVPILNVGVGPFQKVNATAMEMSSMLCSFAVVAVRPMPMPMAFVMIKMIASEHWMHAVSVMDLVLSMNVAVKA